MTSTTTTRTHTRALLHTAKHRRHARADGCWVLLPAVALSVLGALSG